MSAPRLVVTADDVGLDPGITEGALTALRDGIVTDLSVLVARDDWGRTVVALREAGVAEIGVHLTLCEGRPVLPPHEVPALVADDGRFPTSGARVALRRATARLGRRQVRREWLAQVRRAQAAGFRVTHLDGHKHFHLLPGLFGVALDVAQTCGVRGIRLSREPGPGAQATVREVLARLSAWPARRVARAGLAITDRVAGIGVAGGLTTDTLVGLLRDLPEGTTELIVHPGKTGAPLPEGLGVEGLVWEAG